MAVLKRRQGVRNRRETDGIVKNFKAVKTVHEALEIVCELYVTENYRDRTINDYQVLGRIHGGSRYHAV
ncbi:MULTISPECIES: hypothetical protein [Bacillus]|uniref:hypothetical protein n=1 Tax=Bacillus TaxID=1386 RepID=UPI00136697A4|nr:MULTISPECIES: hypothetical protein [Bacillus amyloliquefaciens group]MCJ2174744.1 hypothetical protein [Bacillus amyloliquefaciens]MCR4352002.1 hypothetical protein [Bacillus amyloliquefaciens]MCR4358870.1 hypothetical protein [Bacillus amyloliquefaciens]MDX7982296.1 hypothetical protein [Bacillus velezensis]MEC1480758.1 hypothetical protein [Bacillus velezensis]